MIYLDYAATTPVDPRVLDKMMPYYREQFGNPSSIHRYGQHAEAAVETAREAVARILNCLPEEIIFTSCGTESDNLAIRGAALAAREKNGSNRILSSRAEHPAVTKTIEQLEKHFGFEAIWLDVGQNGIHKPEIVGAAITAKSALVSIMYANNEIGSISPISKIAGICHQKGIAFHTDAVQAAAYQPLDVKSLNVDFMSLGGHKFYGPKGVGVLYVRKDAGLIPHLTGGGQENGLRAGTQNVPYIVGFAEALRLADEERSVRTDHVKPLRDRIIGSVLEGIPDSRLSGDLMQRLPNHASFVFKEMDGNLLLNLLDSAGFACSSGSACKTGNPEPSEVLRALGLERKWALGSLRVTLGSATTTADIDQFLKALPPLVEKARSLYRK